MRSAHRIISKWANRASRGGGKEEVQRHSLRVTGLTLGLTAVSEREEFRLQEHSLWPTVLPEGSACNKAEPSIWGRDIGVNTDYRRVRTVV